MSAWSCSFTKHELHLRVTAKCCKSFFLALKTRFTPLQSFSCACKFYLRLQSYVHFHKSYHTHANLLGVKLPSYWSHRCDRTRQRVKSMQRRDRQSCGAIRAKEAVRMTRFVQITWRELSVWGVWRAFRAIRKIGTLADICAVLTNQELALAVTWLRAEGENPKQQSRTVV